MKKSILTFLLLWPSLVSAQIIPTLPVILTNGSLADANQVMSDFNTIVSGVNTNGAKNGANSDITSLNALSTPITPAQGGSSVYTGSDAGSANTYAVAATTPTGFTLRAGNTVIFIPANTNTTASTLTTGGAAAVAILKQTATGLAPLTGGEIVALQQALVIYDGIQYELLNSAVTANVQPCTTIDYSGVVAPSGYLIANGAAVLRASFPNLFSCLAFTSVAATLNGTTTVTVPNSALFEVGWFVGGPNVTCNSTILSIPGGGTTIVLSNAAGASGASTLAIGPFPLGDCSTMFNLPNYQGRATVMADTSGGTLPTATATATGTAVGTALTLTSVSGTIEPGLMLSGGPSGAIPVGTVIVSQTSGTTGGAGVYVTSQATTVSAAALSFSFCANSSSIGSTCGAATLTLLASNSPPYTPVVTSTPTAGGPLALGVASGSGTVATGTGAVTTFQSGSFANIVISNSVTGNGGLSYPTSKLQPIGLVTKAIKF